MIMIHFQVSERVGGEYGVNISEIYISSAWIFTIFNHWSELNSFEVDETIQTSKQFILILFQNFKIDLFI